MFDPVIPSGARNLTLEVAVTLAKLRDAQTLREIRRFAQDDTRRYPARCQLTFLTKTPTMASRFRDSSYAEIFGGHRPPLQRLKGANYL